jgi:hypothetical protein
MSAGCTTGYILAVPDAEPRVKQDKGTGHWQPSKRSSAHFLFFLGGVVRHGIGGTGSHSTKNGHCFTVDQYECVHWDQCTSETYYNQITAIEV